MNLETINIESGKGGVKIMTLNRPDAKNALSIKMRIEISAALAEMRDDKKTRALVITGGGSTFCAGFDLKEFGDKSVYMELFESSSKYHRDLWNFPKPVIAAINGAALGGGFDLATLCDIRICSQKAFFAHPEIKFGGPPLFTPLRWIVGDGLARDLCLTGRKIDAEEARRILLCSEVTTPETLMDRALEIAAMILQAPDGTLAVAKRYMIGNAGKNFEESFSEEHDSIFRRFLEDASGQ